MDKIPFPIPAGTEAAGVRGNEKHENEEVHRSFINLSFASGPGAGHRIMGQTRLCHVAPKPRCLFRDLGAEMVLPAPI